MLSGLRESFSEFRNGRREIDSYMIHKILENELRSGLSQLSKKPTDIDSLLEDLENVAYARIAGKYRRFREGFIWLRPTHTRKPRIRYDLRSAVLSLSREDMSFKSFLVNAKLLEMLDSMLEDPETFWKELKGEIDELNSKNSR